jgi:hypothetical protein
MTAREISELVPMPRLLFALGFFVHDRTRRCPCLLHGGRNVSAFCWRPNGRWICFSCGAAGDRIDLVRKVRSCSFREAVSFLAQLAGGHCISESLTNLNLREVSKRTQRATAAAWRIRDEVLRLRGYYRGGLHRSERLAAKLTQMAVHSRTQLEEDIAWQRLAQLAPAQSFFFAAHMFLSICSNSELVRFALASPKQRRAFILGDSDDDVAL